MRPRFIYFDIDDTLLDHRAAERAALADLHGAFAECFNGCSVEELQEVYYKHNLDLWRQYADGAIAKDVLKRRRFEHLVQTLAMAEEVEAEALGAHYMRRYAEHWTFPDAARRAFKRLADRYPVGLLTNGFTETQWAKLRRFPLLRHRAAVVLVSEEVGHMKPHPALFAHATEAAGVPAEDILYVGNSYYSDVQGGLRAGWQVAWYTETAPDEAGGVFCFDRWEALTTRLLG